MALLCHASAVAGYAEFEDDGVMDHPVDGGRGSHRVLEDPVPFGEDQVRADTQRTPLVPLRHQGEQDLGLLGTLWKIAQVVDDQEIEVVQLAKRPW